jgi:integrase/recombinase XerD
MLESVDQTVVVDPAAIAAHVERAVILSTATRTGHTLTQHIAAWLGSFTESPDTCAAYGRDIEQYIQWCARRQLDPMTVRLPEIQMYGAEMADTVNPRTARPLAASSRARMLAAVSSFYTFLVRADALDTNPAREARRPKYDRRHSSTASLTSTQATKVLITGRTLAHRTLSAEAVALASALLVNLGIRVSELCNANLSDLGQREGLRTLTVHMKGRKIRVRPIPAQVAPLLDSYLAVRPTPASNVDADALLLDKNGSRLSRHQVARLTQRLAAKAGVPLPEKITPHAMRHTFNTVAKEKNVPLEDRQEALGHSSADVTALYDHADRSLSRDPAHLVAAATAPAGDPSVQ